jgi:NADPH-dependent 2,4-dienoyl-CoA reductase/sulfur reductase-like enzyme
MRKSRYDVLLLGGGTACGYAAAAFRERDKESSLAIVSAEDQPPYDRPPLSKKFIVRDDFVPEDIHAKDPSFYDENDVDLYRQERVVRIETDARRVVLESGRTLEYGKALYALGSSPIEIPDLLQGDAATLRTVQDAIKIRRHLAQAQSVAIVGGGYIGAEAAAALLDKGISVTLIERGPHLWARFESREVAQAVHRYLKERGARILTEATAVERKPGTLRTSDGEELRADFVLVCVGARPNLEVAKTAGLEIGETGVKANPNLRTSDERIWAAGDVVEYPDVVAGRTVRIEHHLHAKWTGEKAGAALAGETSAYRRVPYFFSDVGELSMILRGDPRPEHRVFTFGDPSEPVVSQVFLDENGVVKGFIDLRKDYTAQEPLDAMFEQLILAQKNLSGRLEDLQRSSFHLLDLNG